MMRLTLTGVHMDAASAEHRRGPPLAGRTSAAGKRPEGYLCFLETLKWLAMAMTA